jgi:hypothetical protein
MKISLIGPGIKPIPSTGWGAIEIIVWDYYQKLTKLGHQVDIINTQNLNNVVDKCNKNNYDIVHIMYDDYISIANRLNCKNIYYTSHFAYITHPNFPTLYSNYFNNIFKKVISLQHKVQVKSISSEIRDVYIKHGSNPHTIDVIRNCSREDLFNYTKNPTNKNKSVYVGKIEKRKRQYLYQNIPNMDFVGNFYNSSFNQKNDNYLGEWSREELYNGLTNYSNLVLLSNGEGDPLVVKEGLLSGLGVVVSECASANLDTSLLFIDVIPNNKITDIPYVESIITKNRLVSMEMREDIRSYALNNFSSDVVINSYIQSTGLQKEEAYVFIAIGDKYIKEAINLVNSLKLWDRNRDYVLISDSNKLYPDFNHVVDISNEFKGITNSHDKYCVVSRIVTPKYITHKRFIMIDTDILCMNNPEEMWNMFKNTKQCFSCVGGKDGSKWHWGNIDNINKFLGMNMKPMHGGVIFFDKTKPSYTQFYIDLVYSLHNYTKLGFKKMFRDNSMTDEILLSYAMEKNNITPLNFIKYPIVSFCLPLHHKFPINVVSWGTKETTKHINSRCILNHFTGLNETDSITTLYHNWIEKINKYYNIIDNHTTVVTGLFNINRETKGDNRKWSDYISWFKRTLLLNTPMVIYCEQDTYNLVKDIRNAHTMTKFVIITLDDIHYFKYKSVVDKIIQSDEYKKNIRGGDRLECMFPIYNLLIMNKFIWLSDSSKENTFNSTNFMWVDAGCSRFFDNFDINTQWPNKNKIMSSKFNVQINNSITTTNLTQDQLMFHSDHFTTATIFGGGKEIVCKINNYINKTFKYMIGNNCINNEQIVLSMVYKQHPHLFETYINKTNTHLPYFKFLI